MKKLILIAASLASMFLAGSCQRENLEPVVEGTTVTYTVKVPGAEATKADQPYSGVVNKLIYEVHRVVNADTHASERLYQKTVDIEGGVAKLNIEVVKDQDVTILFWAQKDGVEFGTENLTAVTMPTPLTANIEDYEAFYGKDDFEFEDDIIKTNTVELTRAVSMLNIGTTAASLNVGGETDNVTLKESSVKLSLPNTLNIMTGAASEDPVEATYSYSTDDLVTVPSGTFRVGSEDYVYVSKNFVAFADENKSTADVTLKVLTDEGEITHEIPSVPFQRNYKTNIVGDLITATAKYTVSLTNDWATEGHDIVLVDDPTSLQAAINGAQENKETEIKLGGDINLGDLIITRSAATLPIVIPENKSIVLDLNGCKISAPYAEGSTTNHTYAFENHGVLTIKNTKGEGKIVARGNFNYGTMTLESGTIEACDGNGGYGVRNYEGAEFVMNGGTVATIYEDGDIPGEGYDACPIRVDQGAKAEIKGGIINNVSNFTVAIDNYGETIVYDGTFTSVHTTLANSAVMTINGGSFTCNGLEGITAHALWAAAGTTTINGGTFDGKDNYNGFNVDASKGATVYIKGGEFLSVHSGSLYGDGTIEVTGGTFFDDPSPRVTDDYTVDKDGEVYKVNPKPAVAKIGETTYTSLQKAVAAVEDGGTITLVANETFTKDNYYNNGGWKDGLGYSGDKSFTIDLGGFTVSQDGALNDYLMWFKNDGAKANTITLKNGTLDAGTTAYCALATASSNAQQMTVNLENINLINNISNGAVVKARGGSVLNVKAGTVITGKNSYTGIEAAGTKTVVNVYEGAKIYQQGTSSSWGWLVGASGNSTVNVYGGEGTSVKGAFGAMTSGGTINISGGEWIANTDGTISNDNNGVLIAQSDKQYNAGAGNAVINVTGGTFKGGYNCYGNAVGDAQINIKGGNFNADPTTYVVAGYEAKEENGFYVVSKKPEATVNGTSYGTLAEAVAAAKEGDTVTVIDDVTLSSELALPAGIIFNGNGKQINGTIYAGAEGNLTFVGHTKVTAFSASYYNRTITIGEGACLEVTGTGRVTLGYGNVFNITGSLENAKTVDKTNVQPSLIIPAGISITGGSDAAMNVTNADVQIGSTTSKPGVANGKFALSFNNAIVEFTKELGLYEPTGGTNPTFEMTIVNSVFTTGTKLFLTNSSEVNVENSTVALGSYIRNSGFLNLTKGSTLTGATNQFGENGGNNGTINVDNSSLTINATSTGHAFDGQGVGSINLSNNAQASVTYYKAMTITNDGTSTFTGTEVK